MQRNWSKEDDAYLISAYPSASFDEMTVHLNRTVTAIHVRARRLQVRRNNNGAFMAGCIPWNKGISNPRSPRKPAIPAHLKPSPVPRPQLGPWGVSW